MYTHLHPHITAALAAQRIADLHAEADRFRRYRDATKTRAARPRLGGPSKHTH